MAAPVPAPSAAAAVTVAFGDTTAMTVQHGSRILDGARYAASSRVDAAVLLQRTYGLNARRGLRGAGQLRGMASLIEPAVVEMILSHSGVRREPLPREGPAIRPGRGLRVRGRPDA